MNSVSSAGTQVTADGATIGQAGTLNSAAYLNLTTTVGQPPADVDGYSVLQIVAQNSAGFGATVFKNDANGSIYIAMVGTTLGVGSDVADATIASNFDPLADADALSFVQSVIDQNPGVLVQMGGHSLGGQEAAYVSSQTGISALVENAPNPAGTTAGPYGDTAVLDVVNSNDIVGHFGDAFTNTVTLDTGASFINQFGSLGTHSLEGLNDILSIIPSLNGQDLASYNLDAISSPYIAAQSSGGITVTHNSDGSTSYSSANGGQETISVADANGIESFSGSAPAGDGAPASTFSGTINVNNGATTETTTYSDHTSASVTDDGHGNSTTQTYDSAGHLVSTILTTTTTDQSTGGTVTVTDTYNAAGVQQGELTKTTDLAGNVTTSATTYNEDQTVAATVDDGDVSVTSVYNAQGQITSSTAREDLGSYINVTNYYYNSDGTKSEVTTSDSDNNSSDAKYSYNNGTTEIDKTVYQGGIVSGTSVETLSTGGNGEPQTNTYTYDASGVLQSSAVQVINADGISETTTTFPDGTHSDATDNGSQTVTSSYDSSGRLVGALTENDGVDSNNGFVSQTAYSYYPDGIISSESTTAASGDYSYRSYDSSGNLQSLNNSFADGSQVSTYYNDRGEVTEQYERFAPPEGEVYGGTYSVENQYDNDGNLVSSTSDSRSGGYVDVTETIVNTNYGGPDGTSSDAKTYVDDQLTNESIQSDAGRETDTYVYRSDGSLEQTQISNETPDGTTIGLTTQFSADPNDATQTASQVVDVTPVNTDNNPGSSPDSAPAEVRDTVTYDEFGNRIVNGVINNGTLDNTDNGGNGFGPGNGGDAGNDGFPAVSFDPDDGGYAGGYAFASGAKGGAGVNVGEIAQYDFANGDYASGVAAMQAAQDANVTENSPSPTGQEAFLEGAKWGSQVITWSLASVSGSGSGPFSSQISESYLSTIQAAFATWSAATGITFEQVADSAQSDVRIGWSNLDTSNTGVLGYTGYEENGSQMTGATIRLEDPTQDALAAATGGSQTYSGTQTTLQQLLLHEIGHVLGLADSSDPSSIMYATLGSNNTSLTSGDIAAVEGLYSNNAVLGLSSTVEHDSASGQVISEYTQNTDGSTLLDVYNSDAQLTQKNVVNADGSSSDSTYSYNSDGSYTDTVVTTAVAGGTPSTTVYDYDSQGNLINNPPDNFFEATQANQTVSGPTSGPDTLEGGFVNDTLAGASGQDTFVYNLGSGAETLSESAPVSASSNNTLQFGSGITPDMLSVSITNDSQLVVEVGTSGDSIAIDGYNPTDPLNSLAIQHFNFSDGSSLTAGQLLADLPSASTGSFDNADGTSTSYDIEPTGDAYGDLYTATTVDASNRPVDAFYIGTDGTTEADTWTYAADGSLVYTQVDSPNTSWTANGLTQDYNADGQLVSQSVAETDGSTDTTTYTYAADGSTTQTEVDTPADGGPVTTTVETFDPQGDQLTQVQDRPDGSMVSFTWTYDNGVITSRTEVDTPAGGGAGSTEVQQYNAESQIVGQQDTNADGSTASFVWTYNADGSSTRTDVTTPAGGGASSTTFHEYDSTGQQVAQNTYNPQSDGSYVDYWSKSDGSQGQYWWNASTLEYQDTWQNADGSSFTDDYQYGSGGTPGGTGVSFAETYSDSSGDQGTRQFNASTDMTTISWTSAQTGNINEVISGDPGFVGLTTNGELTNSQNDPTFFNPAASPTFAALLAAH